MSVIQNSWIEKAKKKKVLETAPSYARDDTETYDVHNTKKPIKRFTLAARSVMVRTLRGIRK